jgi:hypothetical protein
MGEEECRVKMSDPNKIYIVAKKSSTIDFLTQIRYRWSARDTPRCITNTREGMMRRSWGGEPADDDSGKRNRESWREMREENKESRAPRESEGLARFLFYISETTNPVHSFNQRPKKVWTIFSYRYSPPPSPI